ncbi:MAG: cytochrome c biogenesis protein CcsA [Oleiphilaceae bacterium]|nr:cytochrome c biogenesis protein CcsA [Oleiphilaceae bacterium]
MNILALSLLSAGLYGLGTLYQFLIYLRKLPSKPFIGFLLGFVAVSIQLIVTMHLTFEGDRLNLSLSNTLSLTAGLIVVCLLVLAIKKPLQSVFLAAYPVALLSIIGILSFGDSRYSFSPSDSGIVLHIALSILAYSVFSIAAIQAILIHTQNKNLKKKHNTILKRNLPPLLTMENLLFEMIWSGTIILLIAILLGFIFVEDLFAQHLAHKTFFSLLALGIFSTLLVGRQRYGWRGLRASRMTLIGVTLLMLGFFGSKLVLQWFILSDA